MQYRPEIDGLRAIAVGSVILAHAGFSLFKGGFVGVDVFFVISGYLITSIILSEWNQGKFSMLRFYERRARRILPALFVVFLACIPFAWALMVPSQFMDFGRSMAAATLFISNVHFIEKTGYFDADADLQPLLHTWSLAVEEQYYILFPLIFLLSMKVSRKFFTILIVAFLLSSFMLSNWGAKNYPTQNFFFTFSRFWEIFLGAICALLPATNKKSIAEILPALGLGMIVASIFIYDATTPFPSYFTLLPTVGSALILTFSKPGTLTTALLSNRAFVGLGLISYSAYLWHQPAFSFARLYYVSEPSEWVFGFLIILILFLSYLSWKYVETPFRNKARIPGKAILFSSLAGMALFISLGFSMNKTSIILTKFTQDELNLLDYAISYRFNQGDRKFDERLGTCIGLQDGGYPNLLSEKCVSAEAAGNVLVWGDSHAQALAPGFMYRDLNVSLVMAAGCPPLPSIYFRRRPDCQGINDKAMEYIKSVHPEFIVMHANWFSHFSGKRAIFSNAQEFYENLLTTIKLVKEASPDSKIIFVSGVPQWGVGLPEYMVRLGKVLDSEYHLESLIHTDIEALNLGMEHILAEQNVTIVNPNDYLCKGAECSATLERNGKIYPTAWDYGHITEAAAVFLVNKMLGSDGFPIKASE